jgi:chemotaxis protein MotB
MARKKKHEEHENHERWLVSYADFITLLFAFFVVMYSVSAINEGKYRVLSDSMVAAFRSQNKSIVPVQMGSPMRTPLVPNMDQDQAAPARPGFIPPLNAPVQVGSPVTRGSMSMAQAKLDASRASTMTKMAKELEQALAQLIEKELVNVRRNKFWMEVEIKTSILFPSGSAQIAPTAIATLEKIAVILGSYPNPIHVEGFTDNKAIRTSAYPSNWELSTARAASVVRLFASSGIKPERMAAIGYGEHQAIADNATPEGRNANRRVVLVILADPSARRVHEQEDRKDESAPGDTAPVIDITPNISPITLPAVPPRP